MNITNTTNNIDSNTVDLFTIIIEYIEHNHQPIIYTTIFLTIILLSFCTCYFIYTEIHDKYNEHCENNLCCECCQYCFRRLFGGMFDGYIKPILETIFCGYYEEVSQLYECLSCCNEMSEDNEDENSNIENNRNTTDNINTNEMQRNSDIIILSNDRKTASI